MKAMGILMAASALMVMVGATAQADTSASQKKGVVTQDMNAQEASPAAFLPFHPIRRGFCFFHPRAPRCR